MSFNSKLSSLLSNLPLMKTPPNNHKDYLFLDYIEFYAFFFGDEVTKDEILDYLADNDINIINYMTPSRAEESKDELDNQKEFAISYFFDCLDYRSNILTDNYPFTIESNSILLKDNLSLKQKTYLILLMSSMLNVFSEFQHELTSDFEEIVYCVLVKLYPNSTIKSFGKNSDYSGSAQEKIRSLGSELNVVMRDEYINEVEGNQEKGLDLIVWQPFDDMLPNMDISFVQCACGKEWAEKFDSSKRYKSYFDMVNSNVSYIFASSYGLVNGSSFFKSDEIVRSESLFLDRLRIVSLLEEECVNSRAASSIKLVNEMIPHTVNFS